MPSTRCETRKSCADSRHCDQLGRNGVASGPLQRHPISPSTAATWAAPGCPNGAPSCAHSDSLIPTSKFLCHRGRHRRSAAQPRHPKAATAVQVSGSGIAVNVRLPLTISSAARGLARLNRNALSGFEGDHLPGGSFGLGCRQEDDALTDSNVLGRLVPMAGLEPARPEGQGILSPLCLPFHHIGRAPEVQCASRRGQSRSGRGVAEKSRPRRRYLRGCLTGFPDRKGCPGGLGDRRAWLAPGASFAQD